MGSIYQGDDLVFIVTVTMDGVAFAITAGATVRAALIHDATKTVIGPVTCDNAHADADWDNGIVVAEFDAADTEDMTPGPTTLELEINDSGITTGQLTTLVAKRAYIANA